MNWHKLPTSEVKIALRACCDVLEREYDTNSRLKLQRMIVSLEDELRARHNPFLRVYRRVAVWMTNCRANL